jgi:uncharacterized protein (UPF0335 family)
MIGSTRIKITGDECSSNSWQVDEIARLRQQLHDLSTSTSAQMERDGEEIKQLRTFIEELNGENQQLINDLQDCMEEYERLSISQSSIEKEKAALVKLNVLITEERDELVDRLERMKEPEPLEAHHMIQDIRDICNRKIKEVKIENMQLENVMRLQKKDLDHLMEDMIILTKKDAHNERRLRCMENFVAGLHGTIQRSLELNKRLETLLYGEDDKELTISKSVLQQQHDALLHLHTMVLDEVIHQNEDQSEKTSSPARSPKIKSIRNVCANGLPEQSIEMSRSMPGRWHTVNEIASVSRRQETSTSAIIREPQQPTDSLAAIFQSVKNLMPSKGIDSYKDSKMLSRFSLGSSKSCSSGVITEDLLEDFNINRRKIYEHDFSDTESTVDSTHATALDIRTTQDNEEDISGFF